MTLGFLSDAHGNPEGLAACLEVLSRRGAHRLYFLGDSVGYLPETNEVLDLLKASGATCLRGNHEAMLLGTLPIEESRERVYRLTEARMRLRPDHLAWIQTWPERMEIEAFGRTLLLVHGSPTAPLTGRVYPDTDLAPFAGLTFNGVLMGHTHRPFLAMADAVTFVNVGSCGMPRDAGHLASCATYDGEAYQILRVPFPAETLVGRWRDAIHPAAAACLLRAPQAGLVGTVLSA